MRCIGLRSEGALAGDIRHASVVIESLFDITPELLLSRS
jgi:hypothetical protein